MARAVPHAPPPITPIFSVITRNYKGNREKSQKNCIVAFPDAAIGKPVFSLVKNQIPKTERNIAAKRRKRRKTIAFSAECDYFYRRMMTFSKTAEEEIRSLARSGAMKKDLEAMAASRQNPFVKAGRVDVDAYIAFVSEFNDFINHRPKPFEPIRDTDMRL